MNLVFRKFLKFLLLAILFVQWSNKGVYSETTETLNYEIVKKETLKKGEQLNNRVRS